MKKDLILVIFPTKEGARWYYEDKVEPLMSFLKQKDLFTFESDTYILKLCSYSNPDLLRGYDANLIYLYDECPLKIYNQIILSLVKGDHSRIRVVS